MDSDQLEKSSDSETGQERIEGGLSISEQQRLDQIAAGLESRETVIEPSPDTLVDQPAEVESTYEPPANRRAAIMSQAGNTLGRMIRKKRFWAIGGLGLFIVIPLILLFLFLNLFKLNHIKNLFIDYQFAAFHHALTERIDHIVTSDAILSDNSASLPEGRGASLYEKARGFDPNESLRQLGENGLELDFEKGTFGGRKLRSITDTTTGEQYVRKGANNPPEGAKELSDGDFLAKTREIIDSKTIDQNNFFRRKAVDDVFERSGIRLVKWKEWKAKFGDKEPTPEEARQEVINEEITDSTPVTANEAEVNQAAAEEKKAALAGDAAKSDVALRDKFSTTEKIGKFSSVAFIVTMYCIFRDVGDSVEKALDTRIDNMMKVAADEFTKADQQKDGTNVPSAQAIGESVSQYDGFEESAAYQEAAGQPVTGQDLSKEDYPTTVMGFLPDQIKTIRNAYDAIKDAPITAASGGTCLLPVVNKVCSKVGDYVVTKACSVILNPYVQGGVAVVDIVAFLSTLGGEEAVVQPAVAVLKEVAKLAAGVGVSEYIFGHVLPGFIHDVSGVSGSGIKNSVDRTNRVGVGTNLIKNEVAFSSGAHDISDQQAANQTQVALAAERATDRQHGALYALFNLKSPYTVGSRFLASIPSTPGQFSTAFAHTFAALFNPWQLISSFTPAAQATPPTNFHGIVQKGWDEAEINGTKPGYSWTDNTAYIESNFDHFKSKYKKCFSGKLGERLMSSDPDCKDSEEYRRYGMYILDCQSLELLNGATNTKDTYHESDCSDLVGSSQPTSGGGGAVPITASREDLNNRLLNNPLFHANSPNVISDIKNGIAKDALVQLLVQIVEQAKIPIAINVIKTGHDNCSVSGLTSNHYNGLAADIDGYSSDPNIVTLDKWLYDNHATLGIDELIHEPQPAGVSDLKAGQPFQFDSSVTSIHYNHIHVDVFGTHQSAGCAND